MFKKIILSILLAAGLASAQSLADLLPAETFVAFGTQNLQAHESKLEPFVAEFERLELGQALSQVFASESEDTSEDLEVTMPPELEGLGVMDILGEEAWISISASRFNPLPALTLIASLSADASSAADQLLVEAITQEGVESLKEGDITFYQEPLEMEDGPPVVLAYAKEGNTIMLSTNPEVLRGMLRQVQGSNDASFTTTDAYAASLGTLGEGNFKAYFDYAQLPASVASFTRGFGFDGLVDRLTDAFETAGVSAGVTRFTDSGMESEGFQAVNPDGNDKLLLDLLTNPAPAEGGALSFYSEDALSFSTQQLDLAAWWAYLNDITESTPELGGSLDELLQMFVGINLQESLFSWTGDQVTTLSTGVGSVNEPGVASENLLGETVYILETNDPDAAKAGLSQLLQLAGSSIAAFASPSGEMQDSASNMMDVNGVEVEFMDITSGVSIGYAFVDNYVLIATSQDAMTKVLTSNTNPLALSMLSDVPDTAASYSSTNNQKTIESSVEQIISQLQMSAGLTGSSALDFNAVDAASEKLRSYVSFVAERLGNSVSYSERSNQGIRSYGSSTISW